MTEHKIKLWLDDCRAEPDAGWVCCFRAADAIAVLQSGLVQEMSLDHDLGEGELTGYDVAAWLEHNPEYMPPFWRVHSANPVGAKNMREALRSAERRRAHVGYTVSDIRALLRAANNRRDAATEQIAEFIEESLRED